MATDASRDTLPCSLEEHVMRRIPLLLIVSALVACGPRAVSPARPALINHLVFVKLQEPADGASLIADCDAMLAGIPGVVSYHCGTHGDFGRAGIDADYDVALCLGFDTAEAYAGYLPHPDHVDLVDKWKSRWEWIRIHDVVDETP